MIMHPLAIVQARAKTIPNLTIKVLRGIQADPKRQIQSINLQIFPERRLLQKHKKKLKKLVE